MAKESKNLCDMNPFFYSVAMNKGIVLRNIKDLTSRTNFAKEKRQEKLPNKVSEYSSTIIKKGKGIDPVTQENKAVNIKLASSKISGIIIHPGEVFSFWKTVGVVNKKGGYKEGRVIRQNKLIKGTGGGLCNLANTINNLILHSPLEIIEFHKHSDALASDIGHRVPMANGTSVSYNYIDYRFKNNTKQDVQIVLWVEKGKLFGQLRSETKFPWYYELEEVDHHFEVEDDKYYRVSKIYKNTIDKKSKEIIDKDLIWDNHSLVMFDTDLIPKDLIKSK